MGTVLEGIKKIAPGAKVDIAKIAATLEANASKYGVDTQKRLTAFIAQAAHETDGFRTLKEYASGAAYEGRKDLGNTQKGDGTKFRGRGIFQTTGRTNYAAVSKHLFGNETTLLNNPELLELPDYATLSALYYWKSRNLSPLADAGDYKGITKKINGGLNGWADRLTKFEKLTMFFQNSPLQFLSNFLNADGTRKIIVVIGAAAIVYLCYKYRNQILNISKS